MGKSIKSIIKSISKAYPTITVEDYCGCIRLSGEMDNWEDIVKVGKMAVTNKSMGVINDITLRGFEEKTHKPILRDFYLDGKHPDVLIIGAGAIGCAIARELSRYDVSVIMVDKENDVGMAQSSRNDGDIRVNLDLKPGQLKYEYSVKGRDMFDRIAAELSIDYKHTGRLILLSNKKQRHWVHRIKRRAKKVEAEVVYLKGKKLLKLEPSLPKWNKGAFYLKTGGEICPYQYTIALAENAVDNGVMLSLNTIVEGMTLNDGTIETVHTNRGDISPKIVINVAGVFSDKIADMAGDRTFTIHPRKGTMLVLDKKKGKLVSTSLNAAALSKKENSTESDYSKGGGIFHTIHGNVLIGQSIEETPYREDNSTDLLTVNKVFNQQSRLAPSLKIEDIITYFSGTRASCYEEDFVIRKGVFTNNIIEVAATQSPGLTASPAIAEQVCEWTIEMLGGAKENFSFNPFRQGITKIREMSDEDRTKFIKNNPDYGIIVCRCEEISRGEIIEAVNSIIPATTVDAIKRRVRTGMGRCQGGYCAPIVADIISKVTGIPMEHLNQSTESSPIVYGSTKGDNK